MIKDHQLTYADIHMSPNHGGHITPRFIVMHYTATWDVSSVLATFASRRSKVSAHVTVDTEGRAYQHVPFNTKAWHAGPSSYAGYSGLNSHSIGIEIVNPGFLRKAGRRFVDSRGNYFNAAEVGPVIESAHPRVGSGEFFWPVYPRIQLEAVEDVTRQLLEKYPTIVDIVSHEEIDTRGWKTDPGPAFPMNRFRTLLGDRGNDVVEYVVTATKLNLRSGPGTEFNVIGSITKSTKVSEFSRKGDWVRVSGDEWVHGDYLRRVA